MPITFCSQVSAQMWCLTRRVILDVPGRVSIAPRKIHVVVTYGIGTVVPMLSDVF